MVSDPLRDPNLNEIDNHIFQSEAKLLDLVLLEWEAVSLICHSYYDVMVIVLSILGRAPMGATRHNHHLALLIILAKFVMVTGGEHAKTTAPNLVSILFIDEEIDADGLNIIMGATIPMHDILKEEIRKKRYTFLVEEGGFELPGMFVSCGKWFWGQCAEIFALVLLRR